MNTQKTLRKKSVSILAVFLSILVGLVALGIPETDAHRGHNRRHNGHGSPHKNFHHHHHHHNSHQHFHGTHH